MTAPLIRTKIERALEATTSKFLEHPNILLTEDDLRVHLCCELLKDFGEIEKTNDGDSSISLHSEVRWYGGGDMTSRSDIVLVKVSNLDVLKHEFLPSKGYGFNIPLAIIELKFRRPTGDSNKQFIQSIQEDIDKLNELSNVFEIAEGRKQTEYWMVAFDKKNEIKNITHSLKIPEDIDCKYCYSNKSDWDRTPHR